ncbi:uncharacterized protein [Ptychodera flava]|uniref:uncharacterized protein n=1 Tax=Ptychodera flava TaxID=63121 RepID=UPI00396A04EF
MDWTMEMQSLKVQPFPGGETLMRSNKGPENPTLGSCPKLITEFGESTTCRVLPRIILGESLSKKLVWLVIFLAAIGMFSFQARELIEQFLDYDVMMSVDIGTAEKLTFPSVTICNTNKLRLSEIRKSRHSVLAKTDPEHPDSIHRHLSYKSPCLPADYACADGRQCIKQHLRCDGYFHCWDGFSDETNCTYPPCGAGEFDCGQAGFQGVCIPEDKRCDGVHDCFGGKDEENCPSCLRGHSCDLGLRISGYKCVPDDNVCDRFPDCRDGTDEDNCNFLEQCVNTRLRATREPLILYSPGYPSDYANDVACMIDISTMGESFDVPYGYSEEEGNDCLLISFLELDLEPSENCEKDFIQIQDSKNPNITVRYCGSSLPPSWISSSSDVIIKFVSNGDVTGRGYRVQYSSTTCPSASHWSVSPWSECSKSCGAGERSRSSNATCQPSEDIGHRECKAPGSMPAETERCNNEPCLGEDLCGKVLDNCCATISSPNFPSNYPPTVDCSTKIINEGGCIVLTFKEFDIVDSRDCHKDNLLYIETLENGDQRKQRFCGQYSDLRIISASSTMELIFHSDKVVSAKGFNATYEFVPCGTWFASPWGECTSACGMGTQVRRVRCIGRTQNAQINDEFCQGVKPATQKECITACPDYKRPEEPTNDLESLMSKHGHINNDVQLYEDFLHNYYMPNSFHRVENDSEWTEYLTYSSSPDYSDLQNVLQLTREDVARFGHQAEDFILQCSFDESYCDHRNFHAFENDHYGNCFTFNSWQLNGQRLLNSTRRGSRYGLKLTLFIEQDEYIPLYGQEAGVRVLVHPANVTPFPEDEGITVAPGLKTSIGLRMDVAESPGRPHTNCSDKDDFQSIYGHGYKYSELDCHKTGVQRYIRDACGCVDTMYLTGKRCDITDHTQEMCRQLMEYFYQRGLLYTECAEPCTEVQYSKTVSLSQWPSQSHVAGLIKILRALNDKVKDSVVDEQSARNNLLRLDVYYEELNYQKINKLPAYTIEELLADIGGIVGLYISISLITMCEVLDFLLTHFKHVAVRLTKSVSA